MYKIYKYIKEAINNMFSSDSEFLMSSRKRYKN